VNRHWLFGKSLHEADSAEAEAALGEAARALRLFSE
jgi:hypothetical protein